MVQVRLLCPHLWRQTKWWQVPAYIAQSSSGQCPPFPVVSARVSGKAGYQVRKLGSQHGCEARAGLATPRPQLTLYFSSCLVLHNPGGRVPSHVPVGFSYLGDFSEDHPSVLPALSQGLHVSQEFFPLLDFLHHWTGRRVISGQGLGAFRLRGGVARAGLPLLGRGSGSVVSVSHWLALRDHPFL